ncbi:MULTISPECIES: trpE operon leader peptide TrpLE [Sinorhizobium/Ensifer group]|nr:MULTISPECIES: trpE operon leader peptide TrpLE [Sinorhizobium/Ensifer group]MBD9507523.1 trpE operon leader peptide TrpLE [Ensifer sp. ENS10]MBV7519693.1 trpE operon leader peptide TrpLE [Ensifer sp. ENS12]
MENARNISTWWWAR